MGMLIGVAVGWELARELGMNDSGDEPDRSGGTSTVDIRFLGHACFELTEGDTRVLIDPFLTGNPKAAVEASEVEPTYIFPHSTATPITGVMSTSPSARGPSVWRSSSWPVSSEATGSRTWPTPTWAARWSSRAAGCGSCPPGTRPPRRHREHARGPCDQPGGKTIYHLKDTALFSDLRLVGERDELDAALVCIGGHYTMDRHDAVQACELIGARTVVPCHYGTFPTDRDRRSGVQGRRGAAHSWWRAGARPPSRSSTRDRRSASDVPQSHLSAALEPDRPVLPVMRHEPLPARSARVPWRRGARAGRRSTGAACARGRRRSGDYRASMASRSSFHSHNHDRHILRPVQSTFRRNLFSVLLRWLWRRAALMTRRRRLRPLRPHHAGGDGHRGRDRGGYPDRG